MTAQVLVRRVLLAAGALLTLFHVWLFAGQAWDGRLADPALILRWLVAGGLLAAMVALHRQGASIFRGRQAVVIWLLAALLHGPAAARRADTLGEPALPEFVATLTLVAASGVMLTVAWALGRMRRRRTAVAVRVTRVPAVHPLGGLSFAHTFVRFTPRPPPDFVSS